MNVFKWVVKKFGHEAGVKECFEDALKIAVSENRLDIITWLIEESGQIVDCGNCTN